MGEESTYLPSSPSPVAVSPNETQSSNSPFVPTLSIIDQQLVNGSDSEQQTMADDDAATNITVMMPSVYFAAEFALLDQLKGVNDWMHQKTPRGNNVLHIHVGKPLDILKNVIRDNISIPFIKYVLDETSERSLLSQANYEGDTPLHFAARYGQTKAVQEFLNQAEADIDTLLNKANSSNDTALHDAARGGYADIVELLVKAGGEIENDLQHLPNNFSETPLFLAAERGLTECFRIIVEHTGGTDLRHKGPCGQTSLHIAVLRGHQDIVDQIMLAPDRSSLIRIKNNDQGQTPLHCCASRYVKNQDKILQSLISHDDKNNSAVYIQDNEGRTPLLVAVLNHNYSGAKMLINHRPDCIEVVDNKRQNAVHYAANTGLLGGFGFILGKGVNCNRLKNEKDIDGNTPLHLLAATRTPNVLFDWRLRLPIFIKYHNKLDVLASNNNNFTPGDIIASNGSFSYLGPQRQPDKTLPRGWRINIDERKRKGAEIEDTISNGDVKESSRKEEERIGDIKRTGEIRLVAAALIATISFTAGFTVPGGFNQNPGKNMGLALLVNKAAFIIFLVSDAIALMLSSLAIICYFQIANYKDLIIIDSLSVRAQWLNLLSLGAMMMAFVSGVYAVVSPFLGIAIIIISLIFFYPYQKLLLQNWQLLKHYHAMYANKYATV